MNYYDIYKKRLNRYGLDYHSRLQGQRERNFDNYLLKTIYRVDFNYNDKYIPGSLERYKQDQTQTIGYLLTKRDVEIPNGTVLFLDSDSYQQRPWMVWWLEHTESGGYNRYIVLKMTCKLKWTKDGKNFEQWAFFKGTGIAAVTDVLKSASGHTIYTENDNLQMVITPFSKDLKRDQYFELEYSNCISPYVVTELDIHSTPGVEYVSLDPVLERDMTPAPEKKPEDNKDDFYWLDGGK